MKHFADVPCTVCGKVWTVEAVGTSDYPDSECPNCHTPAFAVNGDPRFFLRIFKRARDEAKAGDFTLCIVLCAMSIECELSRLFIKWKRMDEELAGTVTTALLKESWEAELRNLTKLVPRVNRISRLLVGQSFNEYISSGQHSAWLRAALRRFETAATLDSFQKRIFFKRNRIVHFGELDFSQSDADDCLAASEVMLRLLIEMDDYRYRKMVESFG